jgi:hypothetical protein
MPVPVAVDNWDLPQGESVARHYEFTNLDDSPFDLTGYTLYSELRKEYDGGVIATAVVALTGPATDGEAELQLTPFLSFKLKENVLFDIYAYHPILGGVRLVEGAVTITRAVTRPAAITAAAA